MQGHESALASGFTFEERYQILGTLGEGGFGAVYKARQLTTGQAVALKIMHLSEPIDGARREKRIARFLREMQLCAQLHHPNIVQLVDSGRSGDGRLYTVFAFAPGDNLTDLLAKEGALAPREARHMMLQVLDALACAHAQGVVHRDLKPRNIMVIPTGARRNALVLDFGIGTIVSDTEGRDVTRLTATNETLGTPGYAAPEQWRGVEPTPHADLFAWGLVFLECLTGKPVYGGGSAAEIIFQQLGPEPVLIPPELERHPLGDLLRAATRKDLPARDVTARGLLGALEACDMRGLARGSLRFGGARSEMPSIEALVRPAALGHLESERRQVTAMGCRLCVRTSPGAAAGPASDALDEALRAGLALAAEIARRHRGHVVATLGDDLLVYFGYPHADEDDAQRAARAALAVAAAVDAESERLGALGLRIEVKIGLHTGLVVARDPRDAGDVALAAGSTPRLAARLAQLAPPGGILATADAHWLLRSSFELTAEGKSGIDGADASTKVFRLGRGEHATGPTPEGARTPLVGREQEIDLVLDRWRRTRAGGGQCALITGEPGIGKSRLARELRDRLANEAHTFVEGHCSPDTRNSAFFPIIDLLGRALGLEQEPSPAGKVARLEARLARHGLAAAEAMPLFLPLFSLPLGEPYAPLDVSPDKQKELTQNGILGLLFAMAEERPVLFLVEDLHWADPTTLDLLGQLVREAPSASLCILLTARPEFSPAFPTTGMLQLQLNRLERPQIEAMAVKVVGGKALPPAMLDQMVSRTDGVPLFVEELTRMMVESGMLVEHADRYELAGSLSDVEIPSTLRALLTARLDRLGRAKETAQLAAALGREFSLEVLAAVSPSGAAAMQEDLDRLMAAGLVFRRRRVKDPLGVFKHALVRDAAYESLPAETRRKVHARVAGVLEERFPGVVEARPDLLAHHHAAAEQKRAAIGYAQKAAQGALARSAYLEAITGARQAIEWLPAIEQERERAEMELGLNDIIMPALLVSKGWTAPEVKSIYERTIEITARIGDQERGSQALHGFAMFTLLRGDLTATHDIASQCAKLAEDMNDVVALAQVSLILANIAMWLGHHDEVEPCYLRVIELYEPAHSTVYISRYGWDTRANVHLLHAVSTCIRGEPDRAVQIYEDGIAAAKATEHPHTMAMAYQVGAWIHHLRREVPETRWWADAMGKICAEHGFPVFSVVADTLSGWAMVHSGEAEQGLERIRAAIVRWRRMGASLATTFYAMLLADACLAAGAIDDARTVLDEALGDGFTTQECCYHPELHRLLAEVWRAQGDPAQAEAAFARAINMAEEQGARLFQLRALTGLVRLRRAEGRAEVHDIERLRRLRTGFVDIPDVREADVLLLGGDSQPITAELQGSNVVMQTDVN